MALMPQGFRKGIQQGFIDLGHAEPRPVRCTCFYEVFCEYEVCCDFCGFVCVNTSISRTTARLWRSGSQKLPRSHALQAEQHVQCRRDCTTQPNHREEYAK